MLKCGIDIPTSTLHNTFQFACGATPLSCGSMQH
uniref:Uncharacterized protein n=1 Tax=Anguilla anguilla TaxID=7936 RepID=A0A0E9UI66_ANGAN